MKHNVMLMGFMRLHFAAAESFLQLQADSSQGFSAHATTLECAVLGLKNAVCVCVLHAQVRPYP